MKIPKMKNEESIIHNLQSSILNFQSSIKRFFNQTILHSSFFILHSSFFKRPPVFIVKRLISNALHFSRPPVRPPIDLP